jgi:cytochrome oxidase Cu insertion factor (SCO1/SenC/PrrC family)
MTVTVLGIHLDVQPCPDLGYAAATLVEVRMKTLCVVCLLACSLLAVAADEAKKTEAAEPLKIKVGETAPDFSLFAFDGKELKKVSLHDYRGKKNVALAFFVFAFTGG